MKNRLKTIQVTKDYIDAFNRRDLPSIKAMLDKEVVFARQMQPTIIGAEAIMHRTTQTLERLDRQGHQLHMISAIIDFKGMRAYPCMLGILDGERHSVVVLDCKVNGLITSVSILLTHDMVEAARPTEPLAHQEIAEQQNQKKKVTEEELEERRHVLSLKAKKLKKRFQEEGSTQELIGQLERLQKAQRQLRALEEDLGLAKIYSSDNLD